MIAAQFDNFLRVDLPLLLSGRGFSRNSDLVVHELDGLPRLVVRRQAAGGEGVHFLDPLALVPIRQPWFITGFVGDMIIAAGRWLAVFFLQDGFRQQLMPRVLAPRQAWRLLQDESPCRVRASPHP